MDQRAELERKLGDYRRAGVPLIWVIYPEPLKAYVYRLDGSVTVLGPDDALDGEDIIPGFTCPLSDLRPVVE